MGIRGNIPLASIPSAVTEPSIMSQVEPIKGRKALAGDGSRAPGNMQVVLHHGQGRVAEILFQQKSVASVQDEVCRVGMPEEMWVEPRNAGGFGEAHHERLYC